MLDPLRRRVARIGPFARRVATVAGGAAIGQGVLVAVSPLVTRLYTPADLGVLAAYLALIGVLGVVAAWRYPTAIPLPSADADATALLGVSLVASACTGLVVALAVVAFGSDLTAAIDAPGLLPLLWTVPVAVTLLGVHQATFTFLVRHRSFGAAGAAKAAEGVGKGALQLALAGTGGLGLLIADVVARAVAVVLLARRAWALGLGGLAAVPRGAFAALARRYRDFPLFGGPAVLLNAAGLQAPALLFAGFYGLDVAGLFALGQRIVATPTALVGTAASQVYLGEGARLARENPSALLRLYTRTTARLVLLGMIPLGALGVAAPSLFGWVFGPSWVEAGHYVRILAATYALQFVVVPLSHTLYILERQRLQLAWDAGRLVLVAGAIVVSATLHLPPRAAVTVFAVAAAVAYVALHTVGYLALRRAARPPTP